MPSIVDSSEIALEMNIPIPTEFEWGLISTCLNKAEGAIKRFLNYDPAQKLRTEYYPRFDLSLQSRDFVWEANETHAFMRQVAEAATNELQIMHIPIRTITSLKVDYDGRAGTKVGSFASGTAWSEGVDYYRNIDGTDSSGIRYCSDGILRAEGAWPHTPGSVEIIYTAGYTPEELRGEDTILDATPIYDAIVDETVRRIKKAASRFKKAGSGLAPALLRFEQLGSYSYAIDTDTSKLLSGGQADLLPETIDKLHDFVNMGVALMS